MTRHEFLYRGFLVTVELVHGWINEDGTLDSYGWRGCFEGDIYYYGRTRWEVIDLVSEQVDKLIALVDG